MHRHTIIHIDDDQDDIDLVKEAFKHVVEGKEINIINARDGKEGIELIHKILDQGIHPCLILLDINMPLMDGKKTLTEIKKDTRLARLPITLFTTSDNIIDKMFAEKQGVNFVTKPLSFDILKTLANQFISACK